MWAPQNGKHCDRSQLPYPSHLTDAQWAHIAPRIPPAKAGGNKRTVEAGSSARSPGCSLLRPGAFLRFRSRAWRAGERSQATAIGGRGRSLKAAKGGRELARAGKAAIERDLGQAKLPVAHQLLRLGHPATK